MKIVNVSYMERKNLGNYEHQEVKVEAQVEEGEQATTCLTTLKKLVQSALNPEFAAEVTPVIEGTKKDVEKMVEAVTPKEEPKKKAPAKKKEEPKEEVIPEIVKESVKRKANVPYSNQIPEHKSIFAGYLAETFGDTWKAKSGLKDFSNSLNGKDFLTAEGVLVDSFKQKVADFFGAESAL